MLWTSHKKQIGNTLAMHKQLSGKTNDFLRIVLPACATGKLNAVKIYLQDARGFVNWIGPHGRTMLWEAARKGKLDIVKLLAEEYDADLRAIGCYNRETRIEVSPWLIATLNNRSATAEYLTARSAGLDFFSACYLGENHYVKKIITNNPDKADQAYRREHKWNGYQVWPLQYAIVGQQPDTVKLLLNAKADPNAHPNILYDAIDTEQLAITELLLAADADPFPTNHRSWIENPQFNALARQHGHKIKENHLPAEKWPKIVDACRGNHNAPDDPKRVEELIKQGHDVNIRDYKGKTALHRASQAGFIKITNLLINKGANIEARAHQGETPLFDAAFYGRTEQIKFLLAQGADIEAQNDIEETAPFAAIKGGRAGALATLHEAGASMKSVNAKGQSLIDIAKCSRKTGIEAVRQFLQTIEDTG